MCVSRHIHSQEENVWLMSHTVTLLRSCASADMINTSPIFISFDLKFGLHHLHQPPNALQLLNLFISWVFQNTHYASDALKLLSQPPKLSFLILNDKEKHDILSKCLLEKQCRNNFLKIKASINGPVIAAKQITSWKEATKLRQQGEWMQH